MAILQPKRRILADKSTAKERQKIERKEGRILEKSDPWKDKEQKHPEQEI